MSRFGRRNDPDEDDPIAYARAHVTSPGAHALLDEVERGRARRAGHGYEPEYVPGYEAQPDAFVPASLGQYVAWLERYLQGGGRITHVYGYPFARSRMLLAVRDFTTAGECGALARNIIVPRGVTHLGGALGHCTLFTEDGAQGHSVPAYSDPEFAGLPGYAEAAERQAADRARCEARHARHDAERARQAQVSDLSAYAQAGG